MSMRFVRSIPALVLALAVAGQGRAQERAATGAPEGEPQGSSVSLGAAADLGHFRHGVQALADDLRVAFLSRGDVFSISSDLSARNDGIYPPYNEYELGHYFILHDASVGAAFKGFSLKGGNGPAGDDLDSPYALFLSSRPLPAPYLDARCSIGSFDYRSRWISLNSNAAIDYEGTTLPFIDRGMNYKSYVVSFGDFRVGYQESTVYLGESFDFESFMSPLPAYIQQLMNTALSRPFAQNLNTNSLMGFFGTWTADRGGAYAQVLVDDINASFLAPVLGWAIPALNSINNVQKVAWSLGGSMETRIGEFSFHHGGATKYSFESTYTKVTNPDGFGLDAPIYDVLPYPYVYYPATQYGNYAGTFPIRPEDNYIGYFHGENNLSFMAAWKGEPGRGEPWGFRAEASLEYAATGSQSPANPWQELDAWSGIGKAFVLLDDPVIQHSLELSVSGRKAFGALELSARVALGYVWNPLEAVEAVPGEARIWRPSQGAGEAIAGLSLGLSYRIGWR